MATIHGHSENVLNHLKVVGSSRVEGTPHLGVELELEFKADKPAEPPRILDFEEWLVLRSDLRQMVEGDYRRAGYPATFRTQELVLYELRRYHDNYVRDQRIIGSQPTITSAMVARTTDSIMRHLNGFAILKRDGSLTNGVEIVSAPAFLAYHRKMWKPFFDALGRGEIEVEARETCGMHVHVERSALSELQIGQMAVFLTADGTRDFIRAVAGRPANGYCQIIKKSVDDYRSERRYEALNTIPTNTVECRIFASTTEWDVFVGRLEFVRALVSWCRERLDPGVLEGPDGFVEWVRARSSVYEGLNSFVGGLEY